MVMLRLPSSRVWDVGLPSLEVLRNTATWTPKVCRIIAFYGFWAFFLRTFEGLGSRHNSSCYLGGKYEEEEEEEQ